MSKIILGAPSLSGKGANELVAAAFIEAVFPLKVTVSNLITNSLIFPEVDGLFLEGEQASVVVEINDYDTLQRLASSIEAVAEINRYEALLTIETWVDAELVIDTSEVAVDSIVTTGKTSKAKAG